MEVHGDAAVAAACAPLVTAEQQPLEPRATLSYAVTGPGPFAVLEEGDRLAEVPRLDEGMALLWSRARARLLDYMAVAEWVALRAAVVHVGAKRVLVVGDDESATAALVQQLAGGGHLVEGDEVVFTRDGQAVCLPGRHRPGRTPALPLDAVDTAVVVRSRDGGASRHPVSTPAVVQALVAAVIPPVPSPRHVVRSCAALVGRVDGYEVT